MTQDEEKKFSKGDSLDLEARARITFAATAEHIDEVDNGTHQESMDDEELKSYVENIMSEVKKKKKKSSTKVKNIKTNQV